MAIIDISMPIRLDMPVYKNNDEKCPGIEVIRDFNGGGFPCKSIFMNRGSFNI